MLSSLYLFGLNRIECSSTKVLAIATHPTLLWAPIFHGQRFHFLQCRGSSPSLRFVNRHGGILRRAGWVAFTRTYSTGKWLISHLPPTFAIIPIPRPLRPRIWRSRVPVRHVPTSHTWCPQVPRLASPSPKSPLRPTFIHSRQLVNSTFVTLD